MYMYSVPEVAANDVKVHARRSVLRDEMQLSLKQVTFSLTPGHAALTTTAGRPDFVRRSGQMVPDLAHSKGQRRGAQLTSAGDGGKAGEMERTDWLHADGNRESLESSFMWPRLVGGPRTQDGRRANGTYGAPCLVDDDAAAAEKTGFDLALSTNPPLCGPERAGVAQSAELPSRNEFMQRKHVM